MKGLHISDLHLGRPYSHIPKTPEITSLVERSDDLLFTNLLSVIVHTQVELVLISGDTFHDQQISQELYTKWEQFLLKLQQMNITVYLICGNHDPYGDFHQEKYPANVQIFTEEQVQTKYYTTVAQEQVAITAFSYNHPHIMTDVANSFPVKLDHVDYHLGIYHGQMGSGNYAPFQLSELERLNYDYLALGHYHQLQFLRPNICYAGTAYPKKRNEIQSGQVIYFELQAQQINTVSYDVAPIKYQQLTRPSQAVDITAIEHDIVSQLEPTSVPVFLSLIIETEAKMTAAQKQQLSEKLQERQYYLVNLQIKATTQQTSLELPRELERELIHNYQKLEVYQALYPANLAQEQLQFLEQYQHEIVLNAMQEFKNDLEG